MIGNYIFNNNKNLSSSTKTINYRDNFTSRDEDPFAFGMTREGIAEYLNSPNPYRKNIEYLPRHIFNIQLFTKLGTDMSHVRAYNEMVKDVAKFIASHKNRMEIRDEASRIEIRVKVINNGTTLYKKSPYYPTELMKNKNLKQYICFVSTSSNIGDTEIISIPMMIGCEWCATHGKTPEELHNMGENASMFRGYFINESNNSAEPKYFISHKKICHNVIITIFDEFEKKTYVTTLKTQDKDNNSIETSIYKKDNVYYFDNNDFVFKYPVTKIFKQIYFLMKEIKEKIDNFYAESYDGFIKRITNISIDKRIADYFMFDHVDNDDEPIKRPEGTKDIRSALDALFKKEERKNLYMNYGSDLAEEKHFPNILINCIFPSVYVPSVQGGKNADLHRKYNILEAKAMLLMKMVIMNNLSEQKIISTTDRNDMSYKTIMTAAQVFLMDLTRDGGRGIMSCVNRIYKPSKKGSKGETNNFEALAFSNHLNVISKIMTTSTPRSSFSKNVSVRDIHCSQAGNECLFETPSGANIGLVLHTALTACFSSSKNSIDFLNYIVIEFLIRQKKYSENNLFESESLSRGEILIRKYMETKNIMSDEILSEYNNDALIRFGLITIGNKHKELLQKISGNLDYLIKIFNEINSTDIKNDELFQNLELFSNFPKLTSFLTDEIWKSFLAFKSDLDSKKLQIEYLIPTFDCPFNKRSQFWSYAKTLGFNKIDLENLEKKKRKSISLNSIPFALIDQETYEELRAFLKRDYFFMDVAVMEDIFTINRGGQSIRYVSSYNILSDGGRVCRPLFVAEEFIKRGLNDPLKLDKYILERKDFRDFIKDGVIEMVFPNELQNFSICHNFKEITDKRYYEIDPYNLFGAILSCATMANHNPGNRINHEGSSCGGSLSMGSTNMANNQDTSAKFLNGGQVAAVTTKSAEYFMRFIRLGINLFMAFKIETGNVEDSFVISKRAEKLINTEKVSTYEIIVATDEHMGIHTDSFSKKNKYHAINPHTGLPNIGSYLAVDDIIFAKYRIEKSVQKDQDGNEIEVSQIVNKSEPVREGKDGVVHSILKIPNDKTTIFRITVTSVKTLEIGDKLASRYSQKGVEGSSVPYHEMPYVIEGRMKGLRPDAIFSPLSLTSRATPGLLHEALFGIYAAETGEQVDATAFTVNNEMVKNINNKLVEMGHKPFCVEEFYDPRTNTTYKMAIGMVHARVLKHTAYDKIKAVGHDCSIDKATKQPTGKNASKPMRISYMSFDVYSSFGAVSVTHALTSKQSDMISVPLCSKCGMVCDRFNDDPNTIVDLHASKYCTRCGEKGTIRKTLMNNAALKAQRMLLQINLTMDFFPAKE